MLLVINKISRDPLGGREALDKNIYQTLKELSCTKNISFEVIELDKNNSRASTFSRFLNLFGYIDGLTKSSVLEIIHEIEKNNHQSIFFAGSNFGKAVKKIKRAFPKIEIFCFFHNCEYDFFKQRFKNHPGLKSFLVMLVNFIVEKQSCKFSSKIIALNQRDLDRLSKHFVFKQSFIVPMAIDEEIQNTQSLEPSLSNYLLFVGGDFYGNIEGIHWFVQEVMPALEDDLVIVGRGMEKFRETLSSSNIHVFGEQECLTSFYQKARLVIAPIFSGSGMKTKVAEALKFGKKIVGTQEAFTGYEVFKGEIGWECQSKSDFIDLLKHIAQKNFKESEDQLKLIFEENYSLSSFKRSMQIALSS